MQYYFPMKFFLVSVIKYFFISPYWHVSSLLLLLYLCRIYGVKNCRQYWLKMWTRNQRGTATPPITIRSQGQLPVSSKCSSPCFSRKRKRNVTGRGMTSTSPERRKLALWTFFDLDQSLMHQNWKSLISCQKCRLVKSNVIMTRISSRDAIIMMKSLLNCFIFISCLSHDIILMAIYSHLSILWC